MKRILRALGAALSVPPPQLVRLDHHRHEALKGNFQLHVPLAPITYLPTHQSCNQYINQSCMLACIHTSWCPDPVHTFVYAEHCSHAWGSCHDRCIALRLISVSWAFKVLLALWCPVRHTTCQHMSARASALTLIGDNLTSGTPVWRLWTCLCR